MAGVTVEAIQLELGFETGQPGARVSTPPAVAVAAAAGTASAQAVARRRNGPDAALTRWCAETARRLGLRRLARRVEVVWNHRLRTTAGLADCRHWRVELNPRLMEFAPAEPDRTLRHELAHLVAQARAGRRRIGTHGVEWQKACADLGIPGERACHNLPLPRRRQAPRWAYACPACGTVLERVRRIRYAAACADCCRVHNRGRFSKRFRLAEAALAG